MWEHSCLLTYVTTQLSPWHTSRGSCFPDVCEDINGYQNPPLTLMFLEALMCGPHSLQEDGHREDDALSTINMVSQLLVHSTLTTRQIKHKSKESFNHATETTLPVMLPLSTHHKTRSKELTRLLCEVYMTNTYSSTLQLEKRVHLAIITDGRYRIWSMHTRLC